MSKWIAVEDAFPMVESVMARPHNTVIQSVEIRCQNCQMPVFMPIMVDRDTMALIESTISELCDVTGYTAAKMAEIVTEIYLRRAAEQARDQKS